MSRFINTLALSACVVLLAAASARATILIYNIDNFPSGTAATSGGSLLTTHAAYGDNVNSLSPVSGSYIYNYEQGNGFTPDVTVDYSIAGAATNQTYYTDGDGTPSPKWQDVDFLIGTGGIFRWTFTPQDPEVGVRVNSFDAFGYSTNLSHSFSWTLREDSAAGPIVASSGGAITLTMEELDSPYTATTGHAGYFGTLVLEINHLTGSGGAFGMDNLNFDQVPPAPEPSTILLVAAGLVLHLRPRRKPRA